MDTEPDITIPFNTVLVAGAGRSGTTWLGKIFDSSPRVFYKPQPDDRTRYPWFRDIPSRLDPTPEFDRFRRLFAEAIRQSFWACSTNLQARPDFAKDFLHQRRWSSLVFALRSWRKITRGHAPIVKIPPWMFSKDSDEFTLVIKSVVSNMRLAWIHRHFPCIKIVFIVRHPGGYLNSVFTGAREHDWLNIGKKERLINTVIPFLRSEHIQYADTVENGSDFERELIYWITINETPILELSDSPVFKVIVYEELCARPMEMTEELFEFAGIPFGESTRRFLRESTTQERSGYYAVYKNPMHSANKWRKELSDDRIAIIDEYLQRCSLNSLWHRHATTVQNAEVAL